MIRHSKKLQMLISVYNFDNHSKILKTGFLKSQEQYQQQMFSNIVNYFVICHRMPLKNH